MATRLSLQALKQLPREQEQVATKFGVRRDAGGRSTCAPAARPACAASA
ncbi:hypothetical protein ACP70R_037183 [Stipagrostis hirtigluma subsp. patula]